jgi:hypothetical protein
MGRGIRDIESSRELVRYAFALMAKDAIAEVDRGLRPASTDSVTTLLTQRDQKIQYRVTDKKRDEEWIACVKATSESIQSFDRWSTIGLSVAKIGTTVAAGIVLGPWTGFAVATAWNAGDKIYRATVGRESIGSLAKAFTKELVIDGALVAFSYLATVSKFSQIRFSDSNATKVITLRAGRDAIKQVPRPVPVHPSDLGDAAKVIKRGVDEIRKALAKENVNWVRVEVVKRGATVSAPSSLVSPSPKQTPKLEPKVDDDSAKRRKLAEQGNHGAQPHKDPKEDLEGLAALKKVAKDPVSPAPVATTPAPTPVPEMTIAINPALLKEIEEKLAVVPNPEVQRQVDELRNLMSQSVTSEREAEQSLKELADALHAWTPYPELAGALDKLLTGPAIARLRHLLHHPHHRRHLRRRRKIPEIPRVQGVEECRVRPSSVLRWFEGTNKVLHVVTVTPMMFVWLWQISTAPRLGLRHLGVNCRALRCRRRLLALLRIRCKRLDLFRTLRCMFRLNQRRATK